LTPLPTSPLAPADGAPHTDGFQPVDDAASHMRSEAAVVAGTPGEETRLTGQVWRSGDGAVLTDLNGREVVDLGSGITTQALGHCHPDVIAAVRTQAGELENVHDCPTPTRLRAARSLLRLLPAHLDRTAFFNTGAEVVEAALRVVHALAAPARRRVAALRRGFHGKTRGGRALVQWDVGTEAPSSTVLGYPAYCYRCPFGLRYPDCDLLCARFTEREVLARKDVAALVAEPVQGAAGVIVPPPGYWELIADACRRNGVLLVADEVLTGGGRTGAFLASVQLGFEPDLVTLAKGISSGYPVAALAGRSSMLTGSVVETAAGFSSSFGGSQVGLAAAAATLEVIQRDNLPARARELGAVMAEALAPLKVVPTVGDVRQIGLLCGIELVVDRQSRRPAPDLAKWVVARAVERGVRVLFGGAVIRLAPPLVIGEDALRTAIAELVRVIEEARS
jgi:4-aminobutyrate aminotransferase-like enzyme